MKITAKLGKDGAPYEAEYNLGGSLKEMLSLFGEEVVYNKAKAAMIVDIQGVMRGAIKAKKPAAEISKLVSAWKPGVRKPSKSPVAKVQEHFAKLSPEERKALLKELAGK